MSELLNPDDFVIVRKRKNTNLPSFITPRIALSLTNGAIFTSSASRASPDWRLALVLVCLASN